MATTPDGVRTAPDNVTSRSWCTATLAGIQCRIGPIGISPPEIGVFTKPESELDACNKHDGFAEDHPEGFAAGLIEPKRRSGATDELTVAGISDIRP